MWAEIDSADVKVVKNSLCSAVSPGAAACWDFLVESPLPGLLGVTGVEGFAWFSSALVSGVPGFGSLESTPVTASPLDPGTELDSPSEDVGESGSVLVPSEEVVPLPDSPSLFFSSLKSTLTAAVVVWFFFLSLHS